MSAFHSPPDVPWEDSPATSYKYDEASDGFMPSSYRAHYHQDEQGVWHRCYHKCRSTLLSWGFWAGLTMGFPFEHLLWQRVWPFYLLTSFLGIH